MTLWWISLCILSLLCRQTSALEPDQKHLAQKSDLVIEKGNFISGEIIVVHEDGSVTSKEAVFPKEVDPFDSLPLSASLQVMVKYSSPGSNLLLRLSCEESSQALVLAINKHQTIKVSVATVRGHFDGQCRDLSATLTPATSRLEIGEWKLGSLRLPGLAGEEAPGMYEAKASIVHLFRIPDQRPPEVISIIFAGVAALPLLGLVYGLYQSDTNFKGLPTTGLHGLSALVFHGGLMGLIVLYGAFWVRLNLLQTLLPLLVLIILLTGSGYCLLSQQSTLRLKQL